MPARELSAREQFRQHGRKVFAAPTAGDAHEARVLAACALPGVEPVQGALVDMLCACPHETEQIKHLLLHPRVAPRMPAFVVRGLLAVMTSGHRLAPVNPWATRYSVLASPSLDVPRRAVLVSVDDSHDLAARAVAAVRAGDFAAEEEFLDHCQGAGDSLAFMLARRTLMREGKVLSKRWDLVSKSLQNGART